MSDIKEENAMSYSDLTIKRLFVRSQNQCAMSQCNSPILIGDTVVGEICHIRARRKNGPRFDPSLTLKQRNDFSNLILLCGTCHKRVDASPPIFTAELLTDLKAIHESAGGIEITEKTRKQAEVLIAHLKSKAKTTATVNGSGVAVSIGRDNFGKITIKQSSTNKQQNSKYPNSSIGADANLSGYVEYLVDLANKYWAGVPNMSPGRIGSKIKRKFRLGKRTRLHLGVQRFDELVEFLIAGVLTPSPAGKKHTRNSTRLCRSFEEWCRDPR